MTVVTNVVDPTNDGQFVIDLSVPYRASIVIEGIADFLFHRWSNEAVAAKAAAAKGSKAKKTDDIESYVYRNDAGELCIPGEYLRGAICGKQGAAKFRQDPRSSRKSALDLYKAAVIVETQLASLGVKDWDYLDKRRVTVSQASITRTRPAMLTGWTAAFDLTVALPEYVPPVDLRSVLIDAGRLIGVGDFRPTYGRFHVTEFKVSVLE